ncbi:hypothetical protein C1H46_009920 [Malus baccata]|uniref:SET domain-containing protein n=1 Tax=Malus baccata TaxID=106549 RepID=A0A540N0G2_MALBA|nr:hypothetical protein C1H46_009920 [Malus baccata]
MAIVKILEKQAANRFPPKKPRAEADRDGTSRTNVEEALQAYRDTLTQILKERDVKWEKKTCWNRPDIEAAMRLRRQGKRFFMMKKRIGRIPGIRVGDGFQNRAALTVVGLHCQFRKGIDYIKNSNGKIYATSIVNSARYDHDSVESPDTLIYSGEGGNPGVTDSEKRLEDQKLERGNLALRNSMEAKSHVRVVRCFKCLSASSTAYFYDGLYNVTGKEKTPIRAVNKVDSDESPPSFNYISDTIYPDFVKSTETRQTGCDCKDGCSESKPCPCIMKNKGVLPYNDKGRRTNRSSSIVYECGAGCKCSSSCKNRVSQRGVCSTFKLEVFKTRSKAWGVRSLAWIPRDSFVCEYVGEVVVLEYNNNGFQDACEQRPEQKQQPFCFPLMLLSSSGGEKSSRLAVDAAKRGNVGRFVNHSPSPNLYVQRVLFDHGDPRMPHMMLFAKKDIRPCQELTLDFNCNVVANQA